MQIFYVYPIDPIDSRVYSDRDFVNLDNGSQGGTHWTCFLVNDKKSNSYLDSFGGQPEKFLSNQLPKPIINHSYKKQDINSKLCGPYCLYFFYLTEKLNCYNTLLKTYFHKKNKGDKCICNFFK